MSPRYRSRHDPVSVESNEKFGSDHHGSRDALRKTLVECGGSPNLRGLLRKEMVHLNN
jgi:hypothetical protein